MRTKAHAMEVYSVYLRDGTARSLSLLRDIDLAIDTCDMLRKEHEAHIGLFDALVEKIHRLEAPLPEEAVLPHLEQAQISLEEFYGELKKRRCSAVRAPELNADDGVVEAYDMLLETVSSLHNKIEEVRWAVLEHNADMDRSSKSCVLTDPEEIASFLHSL